MSEAISLGVNFNIPTRGEKNWESVLKAAMQQISKHDHSGGGLGKQLSGTAFAANAWDDQKIRLRSNQYLRSLNNAGSGDLNIVKTDASDKIIFDASNVDATTRASLGLAIGTNVQAYSAGLADIAGLAKTDGGVIVGDGANFVLETGSTARASLGLAIGTNVQAFHQNLADIAGLAVTDGGIIVGDGANYVLETGATARASIGAAALGANGDITSTTALVSILGATMAFGTSADADVVISRNGSERLRLTDAALHAEADVTRNLGLVGKAFNTGYISVISGGTNNSLSLKAETGRTIIFFQGSTQTHVIRTDGVIDFKTPGNTSTKNPAVDSPDGWIEAYKNGTQGAIPWYNLV